MANLTCCACKKKQSFFGSLLRKWFRCTKHGVVCPSCTAGGIISPHKCPKCGQVLKLID